MELRENRQRIYLYLDHFENRRLVTNINLYSSLVANAFVWKHPYVDEKVIKNSLLLFLTQYIMLFQVYKSKP